MSLIQKYIWVVRTIRSAGRITLKELNKRWKENVDLSGGLELSRRLSIVGKVEYLMCSVF